MDINTYIARLKKVADNYSEFVFKELKSSENYVLAIPKRRMSNFGTDANDSPITPKYKNTTIRNKKRKGQRTSFVTLKDTGALRESFNIIKEGSNIDFQAGNIPYVSDLLEHYSSNELFGFSPKDNEQIYKLFIKPALEELIEGDGIIDGIF